MGTSAMSEPLQRRTFLASAVLAAYVALRPLRVFAQATGLAPPIVPAEAVGVHTLQLSATQCGCALDLHRVWRISEALQAKIRSNWTLGGSLDNLARGLPITATQYIAYLEQSGQYDEVVETWTILSQCREHASYPDGAALWGELQHFALTGHRDPYCGCTRAFWWDKRLLAEDRVEHHVEHPQTVRCPRHAHLTDPCAHGDVIVAENRRLTAAKAAAEVI